MQTRHVEFLIQGLPQEGQVAHVSPHFSSVSLGRSVTAAALSWGAETGATLVGWSCLPPKQDSGTSSALTTSLGYRKRLHTKNQRHKPEGPLMRVEALEASVSISLVQMPTETAFFEENFNTDNSCLPAVTFLVVSCGAPLLGPPAFHIICVRVERGDEHQKVIRGQDRVLARGHPKPPVSSDN